MYPFHEKKGQPDPTKSSLCSICSSPAQADRGGLAGTSKDGAKGDGAMLVVEVGTPLIVMVDGDKIGDKIGARTGPVRDGTPTATGMATVCNIKPIDPLLPT